MYLRRCYRVKDGKRHAYWALVKSVRTARGPRQDVVAYLGEMDEAGRLGMEQLASGRGEDSQATMFGPSTQPRWVEVDPSRVRVQNTRSFGGSWLALQVIHQLGLRDLLEALMPAGREEVPWPLMSLVLVICRLCNPSSELRIAEHLYERTALSDLLGIGSEKVNGQIKGVDKSKGSGQIKGVGTNQRGRESLIQNQRLPTPLISTRGTRRM